MAYVLSPNDETRRLLEGLKVIKAPMPSHDTTAQEHGKHALTPAQADKVLRAWSGDTLKDKRNRALIAVLFCRA